MRARDIQASPNVCEACQQKVPTRVIVGLEANPSCQLPILLCKRCGPIELDTMQFCREIAIGCNDN